MTNSDNQFPVTPDSLEQLAKELDARMPALLAEVRDLLAGEWPNYAAFLDQHEPQVAEASVLFVHRLLEMAEHGPGPADRDHGGDHDRAQRVFEQIGQRQFQDGLELSYLLSAYQVGARAAWRQVAATALKLGLEPHVLAALAEAVFLFVDEFSTASAHGYVLEQSAASAARERRREELADLLLSGRSDLIGIRAAAQRAGWPLPADVAVLLADPADGDARTALERIGRNALPIRRPDAVGALVPNPGAGPRPRIDEALRGRAVVIGHPLPLDLLPAGMRIAQTALRLRTCGVLQGSPVLVGEHLDTIIANRDEWLLSVLRGQVLQPLRDLPEGTRDRLIETLRSWLWNLGDRQAIARDLHIHPQTVRYRLGRLHELFGAQLDSPRDRARLFLALIWDVPHDPH
jgi:hypothetical protein